MALPCGKSISLICASYGFCVVSKKHYKIKREARDILQGLSIRVSTWLPS